MPKLLLSPNTNPQVEDLKREPIEFYAKYKRLLHKDYDPYITTFKLAFAPSPYRPINQKEFDELGRSIQESSYQEGWIYNRE